MLRKQNIFGRDKEVMVRRAARDDPSCSTKMNKSH
jgi:hypothetical protein